MKKLGGKFPLIVEPHPEDYNGYEFITLVRYNDEDYLNIIDNMCNKQIITYVLDYCGPANVDEQLIVNIAQEWYHNNKENYPISVEFSKLNLAEHTTKILRYFPIDYVSRVIGPLPAYNMQGPIKEKRRKRRSIPKNIEYVNRTARAYYD